MFLVQRWWNRLRFVSTDPTPPPPSTRETPPPAWATGPTRVYMPMTLTLGQRTGYRVNRHRGDRA
ncbi:hypothetical protein BDK92_3465 [Micromonospora pisi]|uniref:Uncharacterized protein n=1 Tax=Micromonospora pisi TaxID=589240 RepID=A0A495JJM3_9ACTN|nr:hypothetical protein [Micromonospora pisi]RKR89127.1 hypothetical protein BDK92_3465 [Micromonospora pisi]